MMQFSSLRFRVSAGQYLVFDPLKEVFYAKICDSNHPFQVIHLGVQHGIHYGMSRQE